MLTPLMVQLSISLTWPLPCDSPSCEERGGEIHKGEEKRPLSISCHQISVPFGALLGFPAAASPLTHLTVVPF